MNTKILRQRFEGQSQKEYLRNAAEYILAPQTKDKKEKCVAVESHNLILPVSSVPSSVDAAKKEAAQIAQAYDNIYRGARKKIDSKDKPFEHHVLTWHPDDTPTNDQAMAAARLYCGKMDYSLYSHQAVFAIHKDKAHTHVHILINRTNMWSGELVGGSHGWDQGKAQKAAYEISHALGFRLSANIEDKFAMDENGQAYPVNAEGERIKYPRRGVKKLKISEEDLRYEKKHGMKSEKHLLKEALLSAMPNLKPGMGWKACAETLAEHGITIRSKGPGLTYQLGEGRVFSASSLDAREITRKGMQDILSFRPTALATRATLPALAKEAISTLHPECGYPFFHARLSERGIFADLDANKNLFFTLSDGTQIPAAEIGISREDIADRIGSTGTRGRDPWRSRGKEVTMPVPLPASGRERRREEASGRGKDPQAAAEKAAAAKKAQAEAVAMRRLIVIQIREIRTTMRILRRIIKRSSRDPKADMAAIKRIAANAPTPVTVTGMEETDATMSVIAMLIKLIIQILQSLAVLPGKAAKVAVDSLNKYLDDLAQLRREHLANDQIANLVNVRDSLRAAPKRRPGGINPKDYPVLQTITDKLSNGIPLNSGQVAILRRYATTGALPATIFGPQQLYAATHPEEGKGRIKPDDFSDLPTVLRDPYRKDMHQCLLGICAHNGQNARAKEDYIQYHGDTVFKHHFRDLTRGWVYDWAASNYTTPAGKIVPESKVIDRLAIRLRVCGYTQPEIARIINRGGYLLMADAAAKYAYSARGTKEWNKYNKNKKLWQKIETWGKAAQQPAQAPKTPVQTGKEDQNVNATSTLANNCPLDRQSQTQRGIGQTV